MSEIKVYGYRWIVLLLFMFVNITTQILWISYASVTSYATDFYGVEELMIFLLSAMFMIVYIPVTFLASWVIDKYDFKIGTGVGAIIAGIFGLLRFFAGTNFMLALIFTIGIAFGQPFILNSITKLPANWFPADERTSAAGLAMVAQFVGIALGLVITPFIVEGINFQTMILIYGLLSVISAGLFFVFTKNEPPTPPSTDRIREKVMMGEGMKKLFKNKYFLILFIMFFLGLGIFNMIATYVEVILIPRGFNSIFAGLFGGLMLFGGIVGCIIMSTISDKYHKYKPLILISVIIAAISLFGIAFSRDGTLLLILAFCFGFGLLSAAPVALEYAVDLTHPVPEATSSGALMMIGQVGGIIFILGLEGFTIGGDYLPALLLQAILLVILLIMAFFLKEKNPK